MRTRTQTVSFHTPKSLMGFWLILLVLLAVIVAWASTADAQEPEQKVEKYVDESVCNPPLMKWNGAVLVQLQVSTDEEKAQGLYIKVIDDERALGIVLIRTSCTGAWKAVKAFPLRVATEKKCQDSDTSKCL